MTSPAAPQQLPSSPPTSPTATSLRPPIEAAGGRAPHSHCARAEGPTSPHGGRPAWPSCAPCRGPSGDSKADRPMPVLWDHSSSRRSGKSNGIVLLVVGCSLAQPTVCIKYWRGSHRAHQAELRIVCNVCIVYIVAEFVGLGRILML